MSGTTHRKLLLAALLLGAAHAGAQAATPTLTVITHDSFDLDKKLIRGFEAANHVKVRLIKGGDAGEMLSKLTLTKAAPIADVVYGLDNTLLPRARAAGILTPYRSPLASRIPARLRLGELLNTVDVGYVGLNYDRVAFAKTGLPLPRTLADLARPEYARLTVVESPATSSPGSAFLLATVQQLGQPGALAWWRAARAGGMKVTQGWSQAYQQEFSLGGGKYPIVLSYASSPAAEVFYSGGKLKTPPTANLFLPGSSFQQLEGVGVLRGTKQPALARKFVDFMLSPAVQADFPDRMWVQPSVGGVGLSHYWKFADTPQVGQPPQALLNRAPALTDAWVTQVQRR